MTNLQDGASRLSGATIRRIWLFLPVAVLGGIAVLVTAAVLVPLWAGLQQDQQRVQELEQMREQVLALRVQLGDTREKTQTALAGKAKIIRLITGNGDLSTFLAMLDREAREAGVKLTLYEPTEVAAPAPAQPGAAAPPPPAQGAAPAPAQGAAAPSSVEASLAQEGLTQRSLLVSARGQFPALLAFLRRLEALNVLVFQSDLNLNLSEESAPEGKPLLSNAPVVMNLSLGLYTRKGALGAAAAAPSAAAPGAPPAAAPGAPPAAAPPAAPAAPPAASPPAAPPAAPAPQPAPS